MLRRAVLRLFSDASFERRVFIETYGCQMNFNDTELVYGIFEKHNGAAKAFPSPGMLPVNRPSTFVRASSIELADVILLMTCAIRENAESKIWARLEELRGLQRRNSSALVGLLGCMAERLKEELIGKRGLVHVVCGPDAYRDLPRLLESAARGVAQVNTMLSADETYADISPVRINAESNGAYVSVMRGCNNMCSFCIVPFTRYHRCVLLQEGANEAGLCKASPTRLLALSTAESRKSPCSDKTSIATTTPVRFLQASTT